MSLCICLCWLSPFTAKPPFVTGERRAVKGEGEGEDDGGRVPEREEGEEMERGRQEGG